MIHDSLALDLNEVQLFTCGHDMIHDDIIAIAPLQLPGCPCLGMRLILLCLH